MTACAAGITWPQAVVLVAGMAYITALVALILIAWMYKP